MKHDDVWEFFMKVVKEELLEPEKVDIKKIMIILQKFRKMDSLLNLMGAYNLIRSQHMKQQLEEFDVGRGVKSSIVFMDEFLNDDMFEPLEEKESEANTDEHAGNT